VNYLFETIYLSRKCITVYNDVCSCYYFLIVYVMYAKGGQRDGQSLSNFLCFFSNRTCWSVFGI